MSIAHYVSRMQISRKVPPIAFLDDEFNEIKYRNIKRTKDSQKGISKPRAFGYQFKLEYQRNRYRETRTERLKQIAEYRAKNKDKVSRWDKNWRERNPNYLREWQANNVDKVRKYSREYRRKKQSAMTAEEKQQQYRYNREKMIEKYGLEGWRAICAERTRKSRQKRKQNESSKN